MSAERWTQETAFAIVEARMAYYGYTPEQIAEGHQPLQHTDDCELTEHGWECMTEDAAPVHPLQDAVDECAEFVVFVLEQLEGDGLLAAADPLAAAGGEQCGVEHPQRPGRYCHRAPQHAPHAIDVEADGIRLLWLDSHGPTTKAVVATLRDMADRIDRWPTFPLPPSVISALVRERADDIENGGGPG